MTKTEKIKEILENYWTGFYLSNEDKVADEIAKLYQPDQPVQEFPKIAGVNFKEVFDKLNKIESDIKNHIKQTEDQPAEMSLRESVEKIMIKNPGLIDTYTMIDKIFSTIRAEIEKESFMNFPIGEYSGRIAREKEIMELLR